jgi:hypothetical protein
VVPGRVDHVVDRRPVARQQREVDREAGGRERLGEAPQALGVAGEPVEDEDPVGAAVGRPRLAAGDDVLAVGGLHRECSSPWLGRADGNRA